MRLSIISQFSYKKKAICFVGFLIAILGCTSRIADISDKSEIQNYDFSFTNRDISIGFSIQDTPDNPNPEMNKPFKSMGLLVLNVKMKNKAKYGLIINRQDIALISVNGKMFVPLDKFDAASRDKGFLNVYRILNIDSVAYGYHAFGLDEHIILNPDEERSGFLYYKVKKKYYDQAKEGNIRLSFHKIEPSLRTEIKVKLISEIEN